MIEWITETIRTLGYPGIVFLMLAENVFPPIPSEVIMPFAGMVASRGQLSVAGVVLAGTFGSVLGALALYYLGHRVDEERLKEWADRHGKWLTLSREDLERVHNMFDRHGGAIVFVCRLMPAIRSLISIPAGANRMPLAPFLLYTTLGSAIWIGALTYFGMLLGQNYRLVERYLEPVTWTIMGGAVLLYFYRLWRQSSAKPAMSRSPG